MSNQSITACEARRPFRGQKHADEAPKKITGKKNAAQECSARLPSVRPGKSRGFFGMHGNSGLKKLHRHLVLPSTKYGENLRNAQLRPVGNNDSESDILSLNLRRDSYCYWSALLDNCAVVLP